MDEATASSSSTPSTEGMQNHIEGLLQRLPDINSLNEKSSPGSVAGAHKCMSPWVRRAVCTATVCPTSAGCGPRNMIFRSSSLRRKFVEKQPPLAAGLRLFQLFARQACSVSDAWACASLIGRGAILLASSPRALSCAVVSIVAECCCCRSTYIVRCADIFDRSLLRIYLFVGESTYIVRMSDIADSDTPSDPMVADNRGSGDDPLGVPCTPGLGTTVLSRERNQSLPLPSA